jgi:hypothetical protein
MVYRGMVLQGANKLRGTVAHPKGFLGVGLVTWNDEALEYGASFFQILILQTPETHVECL